MVNCMKEKHPVMVSICMMPPNRKMSLENDFYNDLRITVLCVFIFHVDSGLCYFYSFVFGLLHLFYTLVPVADLGHGGAGSCAVSSTALPWQPD